MTSVMKGVALRWAESTQITINKPFFQDSGLDSQTISFETSSSVSPSCLLFLKYLLSRYADVSFEPPRTKIFQEFIQKKFSHQPNELEYDHFQNAKRLDNFRCKHTASNFLSSTKRSLICELKFNAHYGNFDIIPR